MIRIVFLLLLFAKVFGASVCLNMIVKDESHCIKRCLESVKPFVDYWVIVDTGSTDGTQEIIKEFMKEIPGELHERPWVNFCHNRNEAMALAKDKSDYMLFIDADDILQIAPRALKKNFDKDCYDITIDYDKIFYTRVQMVKSSLDWHWIGVVHEGIPCPLERSRAILDGVLMVIVGGGSRSRDPDKYLHDAAILEKAMLEEPNNERYQFYLAQSYRDAALHERAIEQYQKRTKMGGWEEEIYYSHYMIGWLQEQLHAPFDKVLHAYCRAYQNRPSRIEAIWRAIVQLREHNLNLLGFWLSEQVLQLPFPPPGDTLFVVALARDYVLYEHYRTAFMLDLYQDSMRSCEELLAKTLPEDVRLELKNNLKCMRELDAQR